MVGLMAVLCIHKSPKILVSLFWLVCCFPSNVVVRIFFLHIYKYSKKMGRWVGAGMVGEGQILCQYINIEKIYL